MLLEKFYQKRILLEKSDLKPTNSAAGTPYDSKDISSCHTGGSYWPPQAPYALKQVHNQTSRVFFLQVKRATMAAFEIFCPKSFEETNHNFMYQRVANQKK